MGPLTEGWGIYGPGGVTFCTERRHLSCSSLTFGFGVVAGRIRAMRIAAAEGSGTSAQAQPSCNGAVAPAGPRWRGVAQRAGQADGCRLPAACQWWPWCVGRAVLFTAVPSQGTDEEAVRGVPTVGPASIKSPRIAVFSADSSLSVLRSPRGCESALERQ